MESLNFVPYGDMVMFRVPVIKEVTDTGIIKSESMLREEKDSLKDSQFLEVVGIGSDVKYVVIGDNILLNGGAIMCAIDGIDYGFVREYSVIGKRKN